uniref:Uncharacterized protein n=1 Tax=Alexandrium monilatum TaxID=311494 RepID=A0A7S4UV88_9DINO
MLVLEGRGEARQVCSEYSRLLSQRCPLPEALQLADVQALAFPASLLQGASSVDWEVALGFSLWQSQAHLQHYESDAGAEFDLLFTLLAKAGAALSGFTLVRDSALGSKHGV